MVHAFIMVMTGAGESERLLDAIREFDAASEAHIVAGDVDIIATVDVETPAEVKDIAATAMQDIAGVEDTQTYIAMD